MTTQLAYLSPICWHIYQTTHTSKVAQTSIQKLWPMSYFHVWSYFRACLIYTSSSVNRCQYSQGCFEKQVSSSSILSFHHCFNSRISNSTHVELYWAGLGGPVFSPQLDNWPLLEAVYQLKCRLKKICISLLLGEQGNGVKDAEDSLQADASLCIRKLLMTNLCTASACDFWLVQLN